MCWLRGDCPCIPMRSIAVLSATALCGWSNGRCPRSCARRKRWRRCVRISWLTIPNISTALHVPTRVFRNCSGSWCSVESGWLSLPTNFKSVPRSWCGSISRRSVSMRFSVSAPESRSNPIRRWCGRFSPIRMRNPERCCTPGIRASIWIRPGQPVPGRSV